ncbi:uncharacterized protein I303_100088 [Kwoniella dejecticola CBS 10117]|uniref:Uncharacterized protein n=1 Tax=Kwoniella dejecticola CBS 10117 TaxID=1296121 RepID=A0A1A6ADY0_9TREE|nr:uncharacterized protein I303_00088 [Kwoniella dejecticola CBS 10117]OBR88277.1 hypothetical protein I303_00088 [Kwoniella dejecticola CBS 10117]
MSDKTGNLTLLAVLSLFALNSAYPDPLFPFFPFRVCAARHVRIYDQYPVCRDVRATWSVTWFPAAECAIARKNDKRIKNDILEYIDGPTYEKGFSENPTKLKAHTFHENGTEKITELEYDDIGWDDSDEGRGNW